MRDVPEYDTTRVALDADGKAVVKRISREIREALANIDFFLDSEDGEDGLTPAIASSILSVAESGFANLGKKLGVATKSEAALEKRHADLRHANIRIRELEAQLGSAQSPRLVQLGLQSLEEHLNTWWRQKGFGLVSKVAFGPHVCKAEFSCKLLGDFLSKSETPVSDKEHKKNWIESWREQGLVIVDDSDLEVIDCDASRAVVRDLITSNLPSGDVSSFLNYRTAHRRNGEISVLHGIEVVIRRIEDIQALPVIPEKFD